MELREPWVSNGQDHTLFCAQLCAPLALFIPELHISVPRIDFRVSELLQISFLCFVLLLLFNWSIENGWPRLTCYSCQRPGFKPQISSNNCLEPDPDKCDVSYPGCVVRNGQSQETKSELFNLLLSKVINQSVPSDMEPVQTAHGVRLSNLFLCSHGNGVPFCVLSLIRKRMTKLQLQFFS